MEERKEEHGFLFEGTSEGWQADLWVPLGVPDEPVGTAVETCDAISVLPDQITKQDRLWTCAQRKGHPGPHNEKAPADGCTAWADHCPRCAEHPPCKCPA